MEGKDRILASMLQSNTPTGKKIVDITDTTTDGNKSNDENLARTGLLSDKSHTSVGKCISRCLEPYCHPFIMSP